MWELWWNVGTPGEWGSKGLVKVVGIMARTGHSQGVYWGRMVVRATVGAAGGIAGTQHDFHIVRKITIFLFGDVTAFDHFLAEI